MEVVKNHFSLKVYLQAIFRHKLLISLITTGFALISLLYALNLNDLYKSQIVLVPSSQQDSMSDMAQNLGSFASLAGVSLSKDSVSKTDEGLRILTSFKFFNEFIESDDLILPILLALDSWDSESNELVFDNNIFDKELFSWVEKTNSNLETPSIQKAYKKYLSIINIDQDIKTGFITISIKHESPYVAKEWLKDIINLLNQTFSMQVKQRTINSIEFLNLQLSKTSLTEVKSALSQLIQNQNKTLMLIEASDEYLFRTIDPPIVSEEKFEPFRSLICIFGTIIGFIFGSFISFLRDFEFELY